MYVSALASQRLEGKIIVRLKMHFSELFNFNISVIGVSLLRLIEKTNSRQEIPDSDK